MCCVQHVLWEHTVLSPLWTKQVESVTRKIILSTIPLLSSGSEHNILSITDRWTLLGAGITINHQQESQIIRVAVRIDGQMLLAQMMFSVHLVTTAQAQYKSSIVVVGNSIYRMPQYLFGQPPSPRLVISLSCLTRHTRIAQKFNMLHNANECKLRLCRFYCRKGSTSQTSKFNICSYRKSLIVSSTLFQ